MRINKILLGLVMCFSALVIHAENTDSLKIVELQQILKKEVQIRKSLNSELSIQKRILNQQNSTIDSLCNIVNQNKENIKITADNLGLKINETNQNLSYKAESSDVNDRTLWGSVLILVVIILSCIVYILLHKKINKGKEDVEALKEKAEKLNEEILNKFAHELTEMQKMSSTLTTLAQVTNNTKGGGDEDHSLIKLLADRITFMEMTLFKMDPKVRGYKQLSKSIIQMKDNLMANGYEIVDMLGKPYNDGMKVTANFIEDEELESGKQIITGIIKPQINYKGKMIQAAQITVSQNI